MLEMFKNWNLLLILDYNMLLLLKNEDIQPQKCHNPTNNPKQLKTTFVGVVLLSVRKNHHHTTTTPPCDYILATSRQPRKLIFGRQLNFYLNRRNMEDDINIFENGR